MAELDNLLFRGESETLDFKRDQYAFVGATDEQKSKLLKDILAMANSWRTETAHILIGVDAPLGSIPAVVGITQHLDDAALQQFVSSKTQRPVEFRYFETQLSGKSIGVVEVPVQMRPVYLVSNYAGLKANTVYTRRGSSNAEATPDEIARMGAATSDLNSISLEVAFAAPGGRKIIGPSLSLDCHELKVAETEIPNYEVERDPFRVSIDFTNTDFYRDLVEYAETTALFRAVALTVKNRGNIAAKEVRLEFSIEDPRREVSFLEVSEYPDGPPEQRIGMARASIPKLIAGAMKGPPFRAEYVDQSWHLTFCIGNLQPARTMLPAIPFFIGSNVTRKLKFNGRIFADNLPLPVDCRLTVDISSHVKNTNLDQLETDYYNGTIPRENV